VRRVIKENTVMTPKLMNLMPENAKEVYKWLVTAPKRLKKLKAEINTAVKNISKETTAEVMEN
jgi:transcription initiation factor IIE alpha subunit